MMLQTKCKYFNKRIKMVLLLLILMWSLMGQHVHGKSSTYDVGIVQTAAAHIVVETDTVTADDDDDEDGDGDGYDTNVTGDMIQRQTTRMATRTAITTPTSVVSTSMNVGKEKKTSTTIENKGKNNNATIYGHINENDNNSNKLPQNVTKRNQQPTNKMNMNMKMPPPLTLLLSPSTSSSTSSSPISPVTAAAGIATVTPLPPTESLLMAKDQLYETAAYKIPKSIEQDNDSKNETTNAKTDEEKQHIEIDVSVAVANATGVNNSSIIADEVNNNNNNNYPNGTINMSSNSTSDMKNNETSFDNKILDDNESQIKNASQVKKSFSLGFMQQDLIMQFALRFKKISRVTYFTCMSTDKMEIEKNKTENPYYQRHTTIDRSTLELITQMHQDFTKKSPSLMLKIVYIDHLLNKNRMSSSNAASRGGFNKGLAFGFGSSGGQATTRNTFTNANWLEQILRPEMFRQIVVVNLACGESSRRLLEMASNKAFFNTMYHWLLLEDYVFNRQTEIDDADDIENKMNSYSRVSGSKSSMEEIVNGSNDVAMQVKKLSTTYYPYPSISDVVGASTSGSGKLNKVTLPIPAAATAAASPQSSNISTTTGNRQQQRLIDEKSTISSSSSNATRTEVTDENDTEIIEKFLEKLNININTELILAKRSKRSTPTSPASPASSATIKSYNIMPPPPPSSSSQVNSASTTESDDYNTLQKMDYYLLYDVWNPGQQYGGEVNISSIGQYDVTKGLQLAQWYRTSSTVNRRMNMHLANVRCLVVITHKNRSDTLEEYLTTHYDTHLDSMNRFNFALLSHVRDLFNFSFILSKTATWGYLKNGKFDGMIGALVRKQADIGGSPIFFRIERAKVIDYTTRTWVARPCFIFRHPRSTKKDRIVFLQPFSNDVWVFLAICGCITIVLLWILTSIERQFDPEGEEESYGNDEEKPFNLLIEDNESVNLNVGGFKSCFLRWGGLFCGQSLDKSESRRRVGLFFESLLFYLGSICQQGLSFSTRLFSGRCIVITSVLFAFSIYQFYSASIVGTLLMEKPKTIRTLRDLIHSSLEIGIEDIVYNRDYFLRTKDPDAQELYAKKVTAVPMTGDTGFVDAPPDNFALPTQVVELTDAQKAKAYRDILHSHETGAHAKTNEASNWYDPDFGVAKVKKGRFAFHVDVATAYKIIADTFSEKEICDLTEIQLFPPQKMVSIVQKGSPLRKTITYGLRRVTEVGLTDYQRKVWHSPKPRCVKQLHTDDLRVDMQTFTSALLVLIFGYAVSLLILSLEIVHFKLWQRYMTSSSVSSASSSSSP